MNHRTLKVNLSPPAFPSNKMDAALEQQQSADYHYHSDESSGPVSASESSETETLQEEAGAKEIDDCGDNNMATNPPSYCDKSQEEASAGARTQQVAVGDSDKKKPADHKGERRSPAPPPKPATIPGSTPGVVSVSADDKGDKVAAAEKAAKEEAKMREYSATSAGAVSIGERKTPAGAVQVEESSTGDYPSVASLPTAASPHDIEQGLVPNEDSAAVAPEVGAKPSSEAAGNKSDDEDQDPQSTATMVPFEIEETPRGETGPADFLPEATPVPVQNADPESPDAAVVEAEIVHNPAKEERKCFRRFCGRWLSATQLAVGALLIVVLVVVGVVVGVVKKSEKPPEPGPPDDTDVPAKNGTVTIPPTEDNENCIPFEPFSNSLHFLTIQALKGPCSPQSKANSWMMQDPMRDEYDEKRKLQRFALATLFYSTSGEEWKNNDLWLSYEYDECQWYNQAVGTVTSICDGDSSILHLDLSRNSLNGVLPVELFFFPALATLDLSHNTLYGTAPTMFAGAKFLKRLVLSSNQLTGQFTAELGFVASNLAVLQNDDNQFTGAVPGLLRLLPSLSDLNITGNQYTGSLPPTLSQLSSTLTTLEVAKNAITGTIPSELALATNLRLLDIGGNKDMRGTVPSQMGSLLKLSKIDISGTGIGGSLPTELCELEEEGEFELLADCDGPFQCC